jgi:hypothetical protein
MRTFLGALVVLLADRPSTPGSPPAASSVNSRPPTFNVKDNTDIAEHEGLELVH